MAKNTSKELRGKIIYSMSVRNHTPEGTFAAAEQDLDRIKELGSDIILLLPFYAADGNLYAVRDSRAISPECGGIDEFKHLAEQIHNRDMLVMTEMVLNHTSHDSVLLSEHPDWFYKDPEGNMMSRTLNKPDIYDLDYENPGLWDYQIDTLLQWAEYTDGFCCNLASFIPLDFWLKAREAVDRKKPGLIWLADTLAPWLIIEHRARGFTAFSDGEAFQAFDMCFDYYTKRVFQAYLKGETDLNRYVKVLEEQDGWFPDNYCKVRFLENYNSERIKSVITDNAVLRSCTAFIYFLKGAAMIYEGQEYSCTHTPGLNFKDPVDWDSGPDLSGLMRNLYKIKKNPLISKGAFYISADNRTNIATVRHIESGQWMEGSFSLKGQSGLADTFIPDGLYLNLLDYSVVNVKNGKYGVDKDPIIFCSEYKYQDLPGNN